VGFSLVVRSSRGNEKDPISKSQIKWTIKHGFFSNRESGWKSGKVERTNVNDKPKDRKKRLLERHYQATELGRMSLFPGSEGDRLPRP